MELARTASQQDYFKKIGIIEALVEQASRGDGNPDLLDDAQKQLDALAKKYQYEEKIGDAVYKLYELQSLIYYRSFRDEEALSFINQAIDFRGTSYQQAAELKALIQKSRTNSLGGKRNVVPPLQLQDLIRGQRSAAIVMVIVSILSVYFIPWAIFYIILASKLDPKRVPSRGLIKAAGIVSLPLCLGVIPIVVTIGFWEMNKRIKEYEERGDGAFISDKEYIAGAPKRKRNKRITLGILLGVVALLVVLIVAAVGVSKLDYGANSITDSEAIATYTSSEHGFTADFPGFPTTEHSTLDVDGVQVPYTLYSSEGDRTIMVQIAQYPVSDFNFSGQEKGALDGVINGASRSGDTTLVSSTNNGTFLGYPSASASYTTNLEGDTYEMYSLNFIKGNDLYSIMSVGESKSFFDTFVGTFRFI